MIAINYYLIIKVLCVTVTYVCAFMLGVVQEKWKNMQLKIEICEEEEHV